MVEKKLGEQMRICITSLPTNTDEWMRLFMSAVQVCEAI